MNKSTQTAAAKAEWRLTQKELRALAKELGTLETENGLITKREMVNTIAELRSRAQGVRRQLSSKSSEQPMALGLAEGCRPPARPKPSSNPPKPSNEREELYKAYQAACAKGADARRAWWKANGERYMNLAR